MSVRACTGRLYPSLRSSLPALAPACVTAVLLAACSSGGGSSGPKVTGNGFAPDAGPGDVERYAPSTVGNRWWLTYTASATGAADTRGLLTETVVNPKTILGVSASVISQVDSSAAGTFAGESYYFTSLGGVTYLGNDDIDDTITQQLVPYPQLLFPVALGTVATITGTRLPMGVDPFGNPLHMNLTQEIVNAQFAPLELPVGSCPSALQQVTTISGTIVDPALNLEIPFSGSEVRWFAPGVGVIELSSTVTVDTETASSDARLRGYQIDGVRRGVGAITTVVDGLSPGGGFVNPPQGDPVVASDGTDFLVVARKVTGDPGSYVSQWVAQRVQPDGTQLGGTLDLGPPTIVSDPLAADSAAVVFDGVNYIVVVEQDENFQSTGLRTSLVCVRVSPQGALVGAPEIVVPATMAQSSANQPALAFDGLRCLLCFTRGDDGGPLAGVFISPATGQAQGPEFEIVEPGYQYTPALAFNGVDYLVVWAQAQSGLQQAGVFAARIAMDGSVLDPDGIALHGTTCKRPAVACDADLFGGNFLVLWADDRQGALAQDIYANRIAPDGQRLDGDGVTGGIAVTHSADRAEVSPTLVCFDGEYLAAWISSPAIGVYDGLYGARIAQDGTVLSPGEGGIWLTQPGFQGHPVLAAAAGSALLTWFENRSLSLQPDAVGAVDIHPFGF
jgi:hypothetical protein